MSVTIVPGINVVVAVGGTPVIAVPALPNGGLIVNPLTAADQGVSIAEPLYINPYTNPVLAGNGTTFALQPGQSWTVIPGQDTPTLANATTNGHRFSVIYW